jgi:hypothetical protein
MIPPVAAHLDVDHLAEYLPRFLDFVGEYLAPERVGEYERVFAGVGTLLAQRLAPGNATLLHTDPHFWNFLYPRSAASTECFIFDWPLWRTGLAGTDLAYMIGLHLYPEHRRRFEPALLQRYWSELREHGVAYDRQNVQLDYRIGVVAGLLMPVMEFSWNIPPHDWMPKLEKAFATYYDLSCRELVEVTR